MRRFLRLLAVPLLAWGLAGCSPDYAQSESPAESFARCLESHSVDSMLKGEHLLVRNPVADDSLDLVVTDGLMHWFDGGPWVAVRGAADLSAIPASYAAYSACETEVPEFSNPDRVVTLRGRDESTSEGVFLALTAFSRCVEALGFDWFNISGGMPSSLEIPPRVDPDALRETFSHCGIEHPAIKIGCRDDENPELCDPLWDVLYTAPLSPLYGLGVQQ